MSKTKPEETLQLGFGQALPEPKFLEEIKIGPKLESKPIEPEAMPWDPLPKPLPYLP